MMPGDSLKFIEEQSYGQGGAQWESEEVEDVDDERRQILEEAADLDHIWGVWEEEEGATSTRCKWIKQPSQRGNDSHLHGVSLLLKRNGISLFSLFVVRVLSPNTRY
jgi:hypothetical protein